MSHINPPLKDAVGETAPTSPPPKKQRSCLWVAVGCLGIGFFGLIVCCGIGTIGVQQQGHMIFEAARTELNQTPDVTTEIGEIEKLTLNFSQTVQEFQNDQRMILNAKTDRGTHLVSIKMDDAGGVESADIILDDGSRKTIDMTQTNIATPAIPVKQADKRAPEATETSSSEMDSSKSPPGQAQNTQPVDATERELRELEAELDLD